MRFYFGQKELPRGKQVEAALYSLLWWLWLLPTALAAGLPTETAVHIQLRASDGSAVVGERVVLERLPEAEAVPPTCLTDTAGRCTWTVGRGLYQVIFARPLDDVSILALAEGGLRGLGVTVGDEDIAYAFTFHSDGRVYFDAAPDATIPSPIIPVGDVLHGGIKPTLTPLPATSLRTELGRGESMPETSTLEPTSDPETAVEPTSGSSWRLILFIGGGLVIGSGLHVWTRKHRQVDGKTNRLPDQETDHA